MPTLSSLVSLRNMRWWLLPREAEGAPFLEAFMVRFGEPWAAWAGWGSPAHGRRLKLGGLWDPFQPNPFCASMIIPPVLQVRAWGPSSASQRCLGIQVKSQRHGHCIRQHKNISATVMIFLVPSTKYPEFEISGPDCFPSYSLATKRTICLLSELLKKTQGLQGRLVAETGDNLVS